MKIVIIEDQAMFRVMVVKLCRAAFDCERLDEATSGAEGLALCVKWKPDVVLLDLDLPDTYGVDLIEKIAAAAPRARVVVLSAHTEDYALHRCLKARVDGFVDKNNEPPEVVIEAVRTVMEGRKFFTSTVARAKTLLREDPKAFPKLLSDREQEILSLVGQGLSNEEVSERTGISFKTVNNHRHNIMAKLDLHTTRELMRYAQEKGFTYQRAGVVP